MTLIVAILALLFLAGAGLGLYAWFAPRAQADAPAAQPAPLEPWSASTDWTVQAGEEFAGLHEAARCDLVFAVADLNDERSQRLLLHALDDPSDAVALAAAHALARRGEAEVVAEYARRYPGERAERIVATLTLLQ